MNVIMSQLMSLGLFSMLGLGLVGSVIWFTGPQMRFGDWAPLQSEISRKIAILILFVVYTLYKLVKKWLDKRKTAAITKDLAASAEAADPNDAQSSVEIATLKNTFDEALKALKKSSVGGKKISSLYQLPWYIIMGPPGSGKTTLLVNSGLRFPLADKMVCRRYRVSAAPATATGGSPTTRS